jgi:hypothetical protein
MPQKESVATEIIVFDFELFMGGLHAAITSPLQGPSAVEKNSEHRNCEGGSV